MPWYVFNAGGTDISDPNQYTLIGSTPPSCTSPKNYLCAIQTSDNMGSPNLNFLSLFFEIANALNNKMDSINVKLRATK